MSSALGPSDLVYGENEFAKYAYALEEPMHLRREAASPPTKTCLQKATSSNAIIAMSGTGWIITFIAVAALKGTGQDSIITFSVGLVGFSTSAIALMAGLARKRFEGN